MLPSSRHATTLALTFLAALAPASAHAAVSVTKSGSTLQITATNFGAERGWLLTKSVSFPERSC